MTAGGGVLGFAPQAGSSSVSQAAEDSLLPYKAMTHAGPVQVFFLLGTGSLWPLYSLKPISRDGEGLAMARAQVNHTSVKTHACFHGTGHEMLGVTGQLGLSPSLAISGVQILHVQE